MDKETEASMHCEASDRAVRRALHYSTLGCPPGLQITRSMAEVLDASSSDEVKLWLQQVHAALEKQPARELFAKFNRDTTVRDNSESMRCMHVCPSDRLTAFVTAMHPRYSGTVRLRRCTS